MRVAVIAPAWIPVPPEGYGGIERMLKLLVDELVEMDVDVTLFASGFCRTRAKQVMFHQRAPVEHMGETLHDAYHVGQAFKYIAAEDYDLVNDHSGFLGVAFASLLDVPVVHTLHGPFQTETKMFYSAFANDVFYVAISDYQRSCFPELNYLGTIHNAVDIVEHRPSLEKEDYLVYISRVCEDKGSHHAARIARENGYRLVMAGKIDPGEDTEYFKREVQPLLDGERIVYLGEVTQERKIELLAKARAFLFPIQWEEPFGLVMTESLACGTPVVATRWGSIPEVVTHGKTGFIADELDEIPAYLERLDEIDPRACREEAERRFSPRVMAEQYLKIYEQAIQLYRRRKTSSVMLKASGAE
jgi:glycosyltransferase involved in cell wall biosynthesis